MIGHWWLDDEELDDHQRKAIALPLDDDWLVTGPPGSGKTNLLVLRATNLIRSGVTNVLMLVFSRTLEEFIAHCPAPYRLPRDKLRTIQRWEMELINHLGGSPSLVPEFLARRRANCEHLEQLTTEQRLHKLYDVILLDESQDYLEEEICLLLKLGKNIFAVGDSRQQIYERGNWILLLQERCKCHLLPYHYRNGHRICEIADALGRAWVDYAPLMGTSQYNERILPSKLSVTCCADIHEQAERIVSAVRLQLTAYPNEMIGVLCPRNEELAVVRDVIRETDLADRAVFQSSDEGYVPFGAETRICVCTIHNAKGLEFRAVHIAGVEWIKKFRDRSRKLAYTGVTRAKTILDLYHSESLPPFIEGAISAVQPRTKLAIKDLFKA